jgi:hypothetical protein
MEKMDGDEVGAGRDWAGIVEAQGRSQQSAVGFCRVHGIAYHTFLYHRRKAQKVSGQSLTIARSAGVRPGARQGGFIPVRVERGYGVRLQFPGGVVLESDGLPAAAWVVEVAGRWVMAKGGSC